MKKILITVIFMTSFSAFSKTSRNIKSDIKKVTVFTQGAQVFRSSFISLPQGVTELVFSNLSPSINASSVQAGGKGKFIILEVKHQVKYPEPPKSKTPDLPASLVREIAMVEDSLTEVGFDEQALTEKNNSLQLEKNMIQKNKLAAGEGKSDSLAVLKQAMEFFRQKLADINAQLIDIKRKQQKLGKEKSRLTIRLDELRKYGSDLAAEKKYEPVNEVVVTVSADEAATGTIDISYHVSGAGWTPSFDIRSNSTSGPVDLTYKANIFQTTGEEWDDVFLTLNTGNPNKSTAKPELPTWYLNYYNRPPVHRGLTAKTPTLDSKSEAQAEETFSNKVGDLSPSENASHYTALIETMTNVSFDVKLPYSIPSDGISHVVPVKTGSLTAKYTHYLVPKFETEAFLIAEVTGWESLNLLPGKANIFFEGRYVGSTVINPMVLADTMQLSLGRDHGITVKRTKLPVEERNRLLGNEVVKSVVYELKIKNSKSGKVDLIVEDQIPVAQTKEIKVDLVEKNNADYNESTGKLKWTSALSGSEIRTIRFAYDVTYNKDKPLSMY